MLILNVNGPINAGKSTVSAILVDMLPNATFIEVDDLLSDEEESVLGLSIQDGWKERHKRLNEKLAHLKETQEFETVIFAYPIADNTYQEWKSFEDEKTKFLNITLAPSLEECLKNRGGRILNEWELKRIQQMYEEGYQNRAYADFIVNNALLTPHETATVIKGFLEHFFKDEPQWLHLVERRWSALLNGEKTSTFRLNEGFVHKGFLLYKDFPKEQFKEVVYVTDVYYVPLKQALEMDGFDARTPDVETGIQQIKAHYPDITLETPLLFVKHLSVSETMEKYAQEVDLFLKGEFKNQYIEK